MKTDRTILENNPIRRARKQLGMNMREFSEIVGVHYQAILQNESGTYESVLPAVLRFLVQQGYDGQELLREYVEFQHLCRTSFGETQIWSYELLGSASLDRPPILNFREALDLSRQGLAKRLCVQPSVLYKLEKGQARRLPEQLEVALREAGMPAEMIDELNERTEEYYYK